MRNIFEDFLKKAKESFDYIDILYEKLSRIEIKETEGKRTVIPLSQRTATHIRFLKGKKIFGIRTGEPKEETLKEVLEKAKKLLNLVPKRNINLAPIAPGRKTYTISPLFSFLQEDTEEIVLAIFSSVEKIKKNIERKYRVSLYPEVWFFSENHEKLIVDSNGVFKTQVIPRTFLSVINRACKNNKRAMTRMRVGDVKGLELIFEKQKKLEIKKEVQKRIKWWMENAVNILDAHTLNPEELEEIEYFILDSEAIGVFIHEALGHNFEGDIIKEGGSGIVDKRGIPKGRIGSEIVNIIDGPLIDEKGNPVYTTGFGTEMIDDEGVEVKVKILAEKGMVKDFILNRETAWYFNKEPNGGGFSDSGDERICRMSNTYIYPADKSRWKKELKEVLRNVKKGVILKGTLGGAVSKEGMSSSIQFGYLVEQGKTTKMLKPSNFTAKTLYALRYVEEFAGPLDISDVGFCGKKGQTKPVGDGGPKWTKIRKNPYIHLVVQG